jgi:hypothetical protein
VFTKDLGGWPANIVTAHITLTDAQMSTVYRTIEDIRFFDYPATFTGVSPATDEVIVTIPHNIYRLEVRNAGLVHEVVWTDAYRPTTVEADRLRTLISMVRGFIHADPAVKQLPRPHVGCM